MILIVGTAFVDNVTGANYPEKNRDRSLYINFIQQRSSKYNSTQNTPASYYYMQHYVATLKTAEKVAISTLFTPVNTYVNNKKLVVNVKYTNQDFWNVLAFQFLQGKPYTQQQINNAERVAVISEDLKKDYFGDEPNVIGKFIEADNVQYRIAGVVKSVPITMIATYADLFLPYTVSKMDYKKNELTGMFSAIILGRSKDDLPKIEQEYQSVVSKIKPENKDMDIFISHADSYLKSFTRQMTGNPDGDSGIEIIILAITIFVLFFMLLPTLNLVNINISRIMERSSEIGVRKAFGASTKTLVWQFIIENIILTFLGTLLGLLFSFIVLQVINNSDLIANLHLTINFTVLICAIIACLVFGLLSGVYPAWRMSRLQVVTALKAQ